MSFFVANPVTIRDLPSMATIAIDTKALATTIAITRTTTRKLLYL